MTKNNSTPISVTTTRIGEIDRRQPIYCVNALAGSGKTHHAIDWAIEKATFGERILFAQPTKKLIDESYKKALLKTPSDVQLTKIHRDTSLEKISVFKQISKYLENANPFRGQILFITHEALLQLRQQKFFETNKWILIIDEVINPIKVFDMNLADSHKLFSPHFEAIKQDALHYELVGKDSLNDRRALRKIAKNKKKDDFYKQVKPLIDRVVSGNYSVSIKKENWKRITHNKTRPGKDKFVAHALLRPTFLSSFKKVILMSAMCEQSLILKLWKNEIKVITFHEIQDRLRFKKHENKGKLTILYLMEGKWSKALYKKVVNFNNKEQPIINHCIDAIQLKWKDEQFIYSVNVNKEEKDPFEKNGIRLSGQPHGINKYSHIDNVAFLSAINPIPDTATFLKSQGLNSDDIDRLVNSECYQAIMRCSARDPESTTEKTVIVPTKEIADWLSQYFCNVTVSKLEGIPIIKSLPSGRPGDENSPSKTQCKRNERRQQIINEVLQLNEDQNLCRYNTNKLYSINATKKHTSAITLFPSLSSPPEIVFDFADDQHIFYLLYAMWDRKVNSKHDNILYSPSIFGSKLNKKGNLARTKDNIISVNYLIFDFDGGQMTPKDFMTMFPDLEMCCCNTFSGSGRFRACISVTHKMTAEAHRDIMKSIIAVVEENYISEKDKKHSGKALPIHGIDKSKFCATSMFYAPCKAKTKNKQDNFFKCQEGQPLNVLEWLNRPLYTQNYKHLEVSSSEGEGVEKSDLAKNNLNIVIGKLIKEYERAPKGKRNHGFFMLGAKLYWLGLSENEIRDHLKLANHDQSSDRERQIDSIVETLKRPEYRQGVFLTQLSQ